MTIRKVWLTAFIIWACCLETVTAQPHPLNHLGRAVFDSFRNKDFSSFYKYSVFSMGEDDFQAFLKGVRNDALRKKLRGGNNEAWEIAFAKNWRKHWRHITQHSRNKVR